MNKPSLWVYHKYGEPDSFVILYPDNRCDIFRNGKWVNVEAFVTVIVKEIAHKFVGWL